MMGHAATILIPAYNEAAVIARTLRDLTRDMTPGEFQIIVIANACNDDTVEQARRACPEALVLDTPQGGKTNAMNLGFAQAEAAAIVCLDADLSVPAQHIRDLIAPLHGTARAACGRMIVDLDGCSWAVRAFYSAWMSNPYFAKGKFGGLWALSRPAATALFPLPEVIADDEFVSRSFPSTEKAYVPQATFTVRAPKDLGNLVKIRMRSRRGTKQIAAMGLPAERATGSRSLARIVRQNMNTPRKWPGVLVYIAVMVWVRFRLFLEPSQVSPTWERDESTRQGSQDGTGADPG